MRPKNAQHLRAVSLLSLAVTLATGAGCGEDLDSNTPGSRVNRDGPPDPLAEAASKVAPGEPMMRNLSNREYVASLAILIGKPLPADLAKSWTPTTQFAGFDAVPWTNFDTKALRDRAESVERILDLAIESPKVMTCSATTPAATAYEACAKNILEPLAARGFGRRLTGAEASSIAKTYTDAVALAKGEFGDPASQLKEGVRGALGSLLLSPQMLTRVEVPPTPEFVGDRDLSAHEIANRVSFMLEGTIPDDELWAKAEDGSLLDASVLAAQVARLLDTKTDVFVQNFLGQWLDFRGYDNAAADSLERAMWTESSRIMNDLVKTDQPATAILEPGFTYVNKKLADHYGIAGELGAEHQKVTTTERGGILQQGSWLSLSSSPLRTSPIHRGRLVQDRFLCKVVPAPDAALFATIQAVAESIPKEASVRQRLEQHRKQPSCSSCHRYMDPIGLGLEGYGPDGRARTTYPDGKTVETASDIGGKAFANASELSRLLAQMPEYTTCSAEKLSIYALRRVFDANSDAALTPYLTQATSGKAPGIREMTSRLVRSNAFRKVTHGRKS